MATQVTLNSGSVDSAGSLALKTNGTTTAVTINASQGVEFNAGAVGTPSITTTGDTNTGIFFPAADTIAFAEGGTEAMRIDSSGNVGIKTSSPACSLQVEGSSTNDNIGILQARNNNTAADACAASFVTATNSTATSNVLIKFGINNYASGSGQINANGAGAAAFGGFSDRRLKKNIQELPAQLDNIMALRPVEFDYIESEGGGHQIGFVAQEVQAIYPDLIGERADGMLTLSDMNKNDARLIKAIQELKALVDTQASTITQLQADVAALKGTA